jgi:N-acetylneuraminic acid mutarotase
MLKKHLLFVVVILLTMTSFLQSQNKSGKQLAPYQVSIQDFTINNDNTTKTAGVSGKNSLEYFIVDFEATTFPPAGWTSEYTGTTLYWSRSTAASGYGAGTASALFNFYNATGGTTQSLVSPTFDAAVAGDSVKFDHAYASYSGENDQLQIEYSTDGGTNWPVLILLDGGASGPLATASTTTSSFTPTAAQWATKSYALPVGTNMLKFKAISAYGNNLYVDNIKIGTAPSNDVGIASVDMPASTLPGSIIPKASVGNYGSATQTFNVTMVISPGGYTSTKTVTNLAPSAVSQISFDSWGAVVGVYSVQVYTQLAGDVNTANDTGNAVINVANVSWTTGANLTVTTYLGTGSSYYDGTNAYVFSMGGNSTNKTEANKYDVALNQWTAIAPIPAPRSVTSSAATMGYVFLIGGSDGASTPAYYNTVYKYDIASNSWTTAANLPASIGWCKAYPYQDSLIYVVGGYDGTNYVSSVYLYNVNTNTWRTATPLPAGLIGGAFAISGNKLVYVGGADVSTLSAATYVGTISSTDNAQITWTTGADFPLGPRYRWDAAKWHEGIIVAGGSSSTAWTGSTDCYVYNVNTNTWIPQLSKPTAILGASVGSIQYSNNAWKFVVATGYTGSAITTATEILVDETYIPVELTSFVASTSEGKVVLNWTTATETNNHGFQVERNTGNGFEALGFINGAGTTTEVRSYSFSDNSPVVGRSIYRLKQVDFDGSYEYSNEIVVNLDNTKPTSFSMEQNYPNPFNPTTNIKFSLAVESKVTLKVFNILGQEVATLINNTMAAGFHSVKFDAKGFQSGIYLAKIEANGIDGKNFSSVKKMVLTK